MTRFPNEINLLADVNSYNLYSTRNSDNKFTSFKTRVLTRDKHSCSYCNFRSSKFMQVINKDGNYLNNSIDNLTTACPFCAQCHFIPFVGKVSNTGGILIHLPDMSQGDLNALCHVIFCLVQNQAGNYKSAEKIYKQLKLRSKSVDDSWGKGLSNPALFGQMIIDTPLDKIKTVKNTLLKDLRLLPSFDDFKEHISIWSKDALSQGITDPV